MAISGYNFTERVRQVLAMSREEAQSLDHEYVGTEHILLGLVREGEGLATTIMRELGIDPEAVRDRIVEIVQRGRPNSSRSELPYTSRAKKVLEFGMSEARDLHHSYVGTEHLLLGLLREEKGIAAQVLVECGCTLEKARGETLRILGTERKADGPEAPRTERGSRVGQGAGVADWLVGRAARVAAEEPRVSARIASVAARAHLAAGEMLHREILPEHLMVALLDENEGSAIALLDRLGADREQLRAAVAATLDTSSRDAQPETSISTQQIDLLFLAAERERKRADTPVLSTHHLLIAMATRDTGIGVILRDAGLTADALRAEARRVSG